MEGVRFRAPVTLLCVAAVVGLIELGVRLVPNEAITPPKSRLGEILFIEREILPKFPEPQIIFLGTSRIRRAIVPKRLDRALGLPEGSTVNLGLSAGRLFEGITIYERNRARFRGVKLVVLNLDEWQLSSGLSFGSLYEMEAPWGERLRFEGDMRSRMVLDGAFSMRLKLKLIPTAIAIRQGWRKASGPPLALTEENQILPPLRKGLDEDIDPRAFKTLVDGFYKDFKIHPVLVGHVEKLAKMVEADGARLVLMQLPNRAAYQTAVEVEHEKEWLEQRAALADLAARLGASPYLYRLPEECGMRDGNYEDYGHIAPSGAAAFTDHMAKLIRDMPNSPSAASGAVPSPPRGEGRREP